MLYFSLHHHYVYQVIWKRYICHLLSVAILYPFLLLLLTYILIQLHFYNFKPIVTLWRPLHRLFKTFHRNWELNASLIQTFSSIFFLSYANFFFFQSLLHATLVTQEGKVTNRLAYILIQLFHMSLKNMST